MPCYRPLLAFQTASGKITFKCVPGADSLQLPCGKCVGCRLDYSKCWAVRIMHEASLFDNNVFITLTYNNENLPSDLSLNKSHFQKFMKKLRKQYSGIQPVVDEKGKVTYPIRYFHCGEYGKATIANNYIARPHYHAILFNIDFDDKRLYKRTNSGSFLYLSERLSSIWANGYVSIGEVTGESASYVARYAVKKIYEEGGEFQRVTLNRETGEIVNVGPEYVTMSRRPGIGARWYEQFKGDIYPDDCVFIDGRKIKVPRFYDEILRRENPQLYDTIKNVRKERSVKQWQDQTDKRLQVREQIQLERLTRLKRDFIGDD